LHAFPLASTSQFSSNKDEQVIIPVYDARTEHVSFMYADEDQDWETSFFFLISYYYHYNQLL
jgi:hypothetical protein